MVEDTSNIEFCGSIWTQGEINPGMDICMICMYDREDLDAGGGGMLGTVVGGGIFNDGKELCR